MEQPDTVEKDTGSNIKGSKSDYVPGKPYSKIRRELSDDDLGNSAVQKLILSEIDRLEIEVIKLELYKDKFHESDKQGAILSEKLKYSNSHEILYSFCLAVGSAIMSLAALFPFNEKGWIFLVVGLLLLIGGVLSKFIKWK
jgi:hypothetical protein